MTRFLRPLLAIVGVCGILTLLAIEASDARPRGGVGSRGSRTYTPPPRTNTSPTTTQPIQRSTTPAASQPAAGARTAAPAGAARPGLFNRPGFMGGLLAGVLGAGLLGLLFGQGLFGNLAGFASFLGLLIQFALIGGVAYLALRWWRNRSQPQAAFAGMPGSAQPPAYDATPSSTSAAPAPLLNSNTGPRYGVGDDSFLRRDPQSGGSQYGQPGGRYEQEAGEPVDEIGIKPEDYDAFERLLGEVQTFYGKEDVGALRARVTPEMMGYLNEDLAENASRGVVAQLSNVKLLQGDLAEAWAEGNVEYATVALRYELIDTLVERDTQKVVEGDPAKPSEVTELWTFVRSRDGGKWMLSAIQNPDEEEQS